jgi:RNase P/RNase MRP subunit p29
MPEEFQRRSPYTPVKISKLQEAQGRVAVLGAIVSKDKENFTFVIDDGNAQVLVIVNDMASFEALAEGKLVRAMGRIMGTGEEIEILADIVQDFSEVDRALYDKHIA